jgi:hypothetical protein
MSRGAPVFTSALMVVLGLVPTVLVSHYYDVLPNRMVIVWEFADRMTVTGTRARTVLGLAHFAAVVGVAGSVLALWQHKALAAVNALRPFLILNMSQIVAINLTCLMLVTQALGLKLLIKPMIPPAMAVLLCAAGVLCWRVEGVRGVTGLRALGAVLCAGALGLLGLNGFASPHVVSYYASALALLAMAAAALPSRRA